MAKLTPEESAKRKRLRSWTSQGIVFLSTEEQDYWYNRYMTATHCDISGLPLSELGLVNKASRALDHNHNTGRVRAVVRNDINMSLGVIESAAGQDKEAQLHLLASMTAHLMGEWGGDKGTIKQDIINSIR